MYLVAGVVIGNSAVSPVGEPVLAVRVKVDPHDQVVSDGGGVCIDSLSLKLGARRVTVVGVGARIVASSGLFMYNTIKQQ